MCRPLHYLLLQPCASDAQAAAEKWVIQPWGSPALPLSLYPPSSPVPPFTSVSLTLLHSLPATPFLFSFYPLPPWHFESRGVHFLTNSTPAIREFLCICLCLSSVFWYSHLPSFSVALSLPQYPLRFAVFLPFHSCDVFCEGIRMTNGAKLRNQTEFVFYLAYVFTLITLRGK